MKIPYWLVGCMFWVALLTSQSTFAQNKRIDSLKLTLSKRLHDTTRANTLYDIANAFYKQNKFDSTTQYLNRMRSVCIRSRYVAGLGNYNRLQGAMHMRKGMFEEALAFDQAAITAFKKSGRLRLVGQVHHNMGWLYKVMGESQNVSAYTRQGLEHMQQSIAINQRLNSLHDLADNYVNLGILYEDLGEFKQGRECFFKALALGDQANIDPDENRIIYNNLGRNFNAEGDYQQAIAYLNKSLPINLKLDRSSSLAHNYRNLATAYLGLKQPDKALFYAEKALVEVKRSKEVPLSRSVYGVLSQAYEAAGQYDKAYRSVLEQKRIEDTLMSLEKTRTITQLQGKYELQQAQELAKIKAELELAKAEQIASIEANKAKEIAAVQREERHRLAQIKASADVEKTRELAEIETKYETQKRLEQIASLDKENQNRSQQIKLMTGGVGILVILLSILFGQYYIIRRANRRLSVQNEVITQHSRDLSSQSDQLRTLMKELHHRVKNNLAIVSSLLNLQVNSLHDEKAIQAVRIGQQRVEAMSLIHQQLYRTDQLTVINMDEYLTSLAESLIRAYGYDPATFKLQIDIEKQELDVDIAIPIGLIVNELITNAFKYAYLEQQEPLLRIALHGDNSPAPSGLVLEVQDNGPGIEVSDWRKPDSRPSFGKRLIMSLSQQLDGHFDLLNEKGTLFRLHIPTSRLVA